MTGIGHPWTKHAVLIDPDDACLQLHRCGAQTGGDFLLDVDIEEPQWHHELGSSKALCDCKPPALSKFCESFAKTCISAIRA